MNNYTKDFPIEIKPDMKDYYDMRKKVRELYATGAITNPKVNDLCSNILQIRDKNKCIESIDIDTVNFSIEVELEESTDYKTCVKIQNDIAKIIDEYISDNIESVSDIDKNDVENAKTKKLYDDMSVGTYIRFVL